MAETIDELTVNYWDGDRLVRRELRKEVVAKGAWATVMYLLQELDRRKDTWGPPRVSIVRYKKAKGEYRFQSRFNITGEKQAHAVMEVLVRWFGNAPGEGLAAEAAAEADAAAIENPPEPPAPEGDEEEEEEPPPF